VQKTLKLFKINWVKIYILYRYNQQVNFKPHHYKHASKVRGVR